MTRYSSPWAIVSEIVAASCLAASPARAASPPPLTVVLDRVEQRVDAFWNYFPAVTCTEQLIQSKLGDKGKVMFEQRTNYDYLILLRSAGNDLTVDESRIEKEQKSTKGKGALLLTNGFSILTLIFHPIYQSNYEFTAQPDDETGGRRLLRVAFRQVSTHHAPSVLMLRDREYPLEWRGTAWIDPESYAVVRIQAGLDSSMEDVGLLRLDADVTYSQVRFNGTTAYWLPARAVIEAETKRQHWRNIHVFTAYRRFDVDTEVKTTIPR